MTLMLACQRHLFGIPADRAYFNCASLAPLLLAAREVGRRALELRGQPWRIATADWFAGVERRRSLFAQLIGVSPENVALVPAASYGLAVAARNLVARAGQRVIVIADDFPSNTYTWRAFCARHGCELLTVQRAPDQEWTDAVLAALDERVAIAAIPNVHWTDGAFLDLVAISERLRALRARLVVDASQSLGAMTLDFSAVQPDFLVAVGYKWLLGPFGLAYLYVADRQLDGEPLEENWVSREGSDDFTRLMDYNDAYRAGARRFDVGQRTLFEATPVAIAVLEQMLAWGADNIALTLAARTQSIARDAALIGLPLTSPARRPSHLLGLKLPAQTQATAPGLFNKNQVSVAMRGTAVRISPHLYNDDHDVARLLSTLAQIVG
jgi:selenocysteine lyase/cysteine desulfurase